MNERKARDLGYEFHGCYERSYNKDKVVARAAELRKLGNKAVTVYVPDSKLSRGGGGGGYSVYWIESEVNKAARLEASNERAVASLEYQLAQLEVKREELKAQINERKARMLGHTFGRELNDA